MCSKVALLHKAVCEAKRVSQELSQLSKSAKRTFDALETSSAFASMHGTWKQTLMMVYVLSDDLDVAQDFCTYTRTNWKGENYSGWVDFDEMATFLRNNKIAESKWTLWSDRSNADQPAHFKAASWLAGHRTYIDLAKLNVKGITPPAHIIVDILHSNFANASLGARARAFFQKLESNKDTRKYYLRKYRRKWSVGFRVLPQRPPLAQADIIHKEPLNCFFYKRNSKII